MRKNYIFQGIFFLIFTLIILSCKNPKNPTSYDIVKIKAETGVIDTFYVRTKVKIIPLETTEQSVIGDLNKVIQYKNEFYLTDRSHRDLKVFDSEGRYKRKLLKLGKGPGEYIAINNFCISNDNIYILTNNGTINVYDTKDFKFINYLKKPTEMLYIVDFFVDSTYFYLNNNYSNLNEKIIHVFKQKNNNLEETNQFVDLSVVSMSELKLIVEAHSYSIQRTDCKNTYSFIYNQSFDNILYEFQDGSIKNKYELEFGENSIPKDILSKNFETIEKYMRAHDNVKHISNFAKSGVNFIFEIKSGFFKKSFFLLYNSNTKDTKIYSNLVLPAFNLNFELLGASEKGFIGILNSEIMYKQLEIIHKKVKENKKISVKESEFLTVFNENSNPALVIFDIDKQF